jgi:polyisoprenoid-binding protein YceI
MKLLVFFSFLILTAATPTRERGKWLIDYNSQLMIHGKTNVSSFTCFISCYNSTDTLNYELDKKTKNLVFDKNKMVIPVFNFNCGNTMITKDFRKTVNVDKYPYLNIAFVSLDRKGEDDLASGNMEITLAGVTKTATIHFNLKPKGDFLQLTGRYPVSFSDFNLEAPERMMGLVKVQEDLLVEFNLLIRPIVVH